MTSAKPVELHISNATERRCTVTVAQTVCTALSQKPICVQLLVQKLHKSVFMARIRVSSGVIALNYSNDPLYEVATGQYCV